MLCKHYQFVDLSGQTFGLLTVLSLHGKNAKRQVVWKCQCSCGNYAYVPTSKLKLGLTKSCGCYWRAVSAAKCRARATHGMTGTPTYISWQNMRSRCYNKSDRSYADYGGRGIRVCRSWRLSFEAFLRDMGKRPSRRHTIDRISVHGNYEPSNCRWATAKQQAANRRKSAAASSRQ